MSKAQAAIVGAAETTKMGIVPDMSQLQLHADAALNALADAGITARQIDGIATAGEDPVLLAHYLGVLQEELAKAVTQVPAGEPVGCGCSSD